MDKEQTLLWMMTYSGVLALQYHPRNANTFNATLIDAMAANAANQAVETFTKERQQWPGSAES